MPTTNKEFNLNGEMIKLKDIPDLLAKASDLYYNTNKKLLSDTDYDLIKDFYESNTNKVLPIGAPPKNGKKTAEIENKYSVLVGTLSKVNTLEQLREWLLNIPAACNKKLSYAVTRKYDGNSVTGEYEDGKLVRMLTRGQDGKGVDVTNVFFDNTIPCDISCGIKYEAIMTYNKFDEMLEDSKESYANPRSIVAGILGSDDGAIYRKYLELVPLRMKYANRETTRYDEYDFFNKYFPDNDFMKGISIIKNVSIDEFITSVKEIYNLYIKSERQDLNFMIDGLVIEILDQKERDSLGIVRFKPKFSVALKFPYLECESEITGFEFEYGKTGRITPMVCFKPVKFNGAEQKRQSIANYKRFQELKFGIGTKILIQYRNDTLSYIEALEKPENKKIKPFPFIKECPICKQKISISESGAYAYCTNPECPGKIVGKIERYLEKLNIKGFKRETLQKLFDASILRWIPDLYTMDYDLVSKIDGLGEITANQMKKAILEKDTYDYEILAGIGLRDFGLSLSKALCSTISLYDIITTYGTYEFYNTVKHIDGFSDITIQKFTEDMNSNYDELVELYDIINFKEYRLELNANKDSTSYTFCITGELKSWESRDELKNILELRGHKVVGSVSKKTSYLINNDVDSDTNKNKNAKKLGIPIIDEYKLKKLLNI